ncbi:MAG: response regulator [Actinomycetales bacterium]
MNPVRVVVADDHPVFREGLVTILGDLDGVDVVAEAGDGEAAVAAAREHRPDVVLMDLRMPGVGGVEATARIQASWPEVAVLVLTMSEDDESVYAALRAGARGYLLKEAAKDDIARGLRAVARGEAVFGPRVSAKVLAYFASARPWTDTGAVPFPQLTDREREILDHVARGDTNTVIARKLFLSEKTVRNHVSAVMGKIGADNRAAAVAMARRSGLGG